MEDCEHPLCALIGGACSLATRRSRGCRPNVASRALAPDTLDELRVLLAAIDAGGDVKPAAVRLATLVRREALEDRNLLLLVREDEPGLAPALARLTSRNRST